MAAPNVEAPGDEGHTAAATCLDRAAPAIGGRFGLIRGVWDLPTEPDDPRLCHSVAQTANGEAVWGRSWSAVNGGSGLTRERARASAIGESLERYAAAAYDPSELLCASHADLTARGMAALHPRDVPLYSNRQYGMVDFPYRRFDTETCVHWVEGVSLTSGRALLVPACLVFTPFAEETRIYDAISTGLACELSPAQAALNGLYEVVERDAIMITWLGKLPAPRVDIDRMPGIAKLLEEAFRRSGLELRVNDISTDLGIPVAFALAVDAVNDGFVLNAGAAANCDLTAAVEKALIEAAQGRLWLREEHAAGHLDRVLDPDRVITFDDHVRWFGHRSHLRHVDFLSNPIADPPARPLTGLRGSPVRCLRHMVSHLATHGFDVIVVDITPADVLELGFTVVKVLVPGLVDLHSHQLLALKGNPRLYTVPERLGYGPRDEDDLNPVPHPFP